MQRLLQQTWSRQSAQQLRAAEHGATEVLQLPLQLRPQRAQGSIVQRAATLQPRDQGQPVVVMALQRQLELVIAEDTIGLNALTQLLQAQEQPETLGLGRFDRGQDGDDPLQHHAEAGLIASGLIFQSPGHQHQPGLQPAAPEVVLRGRRWQPTKTAELKQPGIQIRAGRFDQLQRQQGHQGDATWHWIGRGLNRRRQRDQGQ